MRHAPAIFVVEMNAVCVDRALAQQAKALVDVQVAACLWKQLARPSHFIQVFGDVAVNEHVGMSRGEPAGRFELGFRGGDSETRRDRVVQAAAPVPFLDQGRGISVAAVRGVAQIVRTVAVHQHLARDHAQVARLGLREESVDRTRMHGAEYQRCGSAIAHQLVEKEA